MAAAGLLVCAIAGPPAFAQTTGLVRGSEMRGFGRLIFNLSDATKISARVTSGVLVISFAKPIAIDPEKLPNEIPGYIVAARSDPDGSGLRLALSQPLRPHITEAGERVFLDLLPASWAGDPPGLPPEVIGELARRARDAEEALRRTTRQQVAATARAMPVRVAVKPDFTRIVFEMPVVAPVRHQQAGGRIEMIFDAALRIDATKLKAQLGDLVKSVESSEAKDSLRVAIVTPDKTEAHGFREDDTFVVDLIAPEAKAKSPPQGAVSPPITAPAPAAPEAKAAQAPKPDTPAPPASPGKPPQTVAPAQPAPAMAQPAAATERPAAASPPAATAPKPSASGSVRPVLSRDGDTIRIALPFADNPPAAAFERHGVATILFETPQHIDAGATPADISAAGGSWEFAEAGAARIMRLAFDGPKLVRLAPEGEGWVVTIGERIAAASEPLAPARALDDKGRTIVSVPLARVGRTHWIEDARTGERIAVAPAPAPLRAMAKPYRFSEFELAPTAHGVAVVAFADDLTVRGGADEVVVARGAGLAVSAPEETAATVAPGAGVAVIFDRESWDESMRGQPLERIRALQRQAAEAARGRRTPARLALARLMFARGLYQEARGVIDATLVEDPSAATDRTVTLLRLAIATETRRFDDARKLLAEERRTEDPEVNLWRAAIDAQQRNWPRAAAGFRAAEAVIDAYPASLQAIMRARWARAAIEVRDFAAAERQVNVFEQPEARAFARTGEIGLLRARIDEGQGRPDEALAGYRKIADSADRPTAAEAMFRGALLGMADKSLSRAEGVARIETVGAAWRGDGAIEPQVIAALGRFYAEDQRWREAFATARRGAQLYPEDETIRALHDLAAGQFEELFAEGKSDSIDRVQALALFYDFKELTPPGRRGDDIVRRLAERLVELDLLDSAADLLQHQIENRLHGAARATLAARLAVVQLMNRKPAAALAALKATRFPELPRPIMRARSLLEARALSELSRTDLALDMAATESGDDVDRLIADIEWRGGRWRAAGETYERILGERWKEHGDLSERERVDVIRAGVAYALADEPLALDRLRGKYAALMAKSLDARAFALVTAPSTARAREFRELAQQVARGDTLKDFLDEYRKRYPDIPPNMPRREKPATAADAAPKPEPAAATQG